MKTVILVKNEDGEVYRRNRYHFLKTEDVIIEISDDDAHHKEGKATQVQMGSNGNAAWKEESKPCANEDSELLSQEEMMKKVQKKLVEGFALDLEEF